MSAVRVERLRPLAMRVGGSPCLCPATYLAELGVVLVEHDTLCLVDWHVTPEYELLPDQHADAVRARALAANPDAVGVADLRDGRAIPVDHDRMGRELAQLEHRDMTGAAFAQACAPPQPVRIAHADLLAKCVAELNSAILAASRAGLDVRCTYVSHQLVTGEVTLIDTVNVVRNVGTHANLAAAALHRAQDGHA